MRTNTLAKKIAIVCNVASSFINFRKSLVLYLVSLGHDVYCFAPDFSKNNLAEILSWGAQPISSPLNSKSISPISDIFAVIKLANIFKSLNIDVVFSCFAKPVIFSSIAAKIAKVPRIVGMIEGLGKAFTKFPDTHLLSLRFLRVAQVILYKCFLPLLDQLVLLNNDDVRDLIVRYKIKSQNTVVLGGIGVDIDNIKYVEPSINPISFLFIGRLIREKGVVEFVIAAQAIKELYPETKFYILGERDKDNYWSLSKSHLDDLFKNKTIEHIGYVNNVLQWIESCSVFVLPSYREGVPMSTQEALAVGRPIITTDVPGCRETVVDKINGFLIKPYCSNDLIEKMRLLIENPNTITTMSKESRELAEKFFDSKKINEKLSIIILGKSH